MQKIKVDVWSDIACPWCYIGKRKLEAAVGEFQASGGEVEVEYHSFLLNPDMPVDYQGGQAEYLSKHKGLPLAQVSQMSERITQIAASVGLKYDFENQIMTNTTMAHRLLHLAKEQGLQHQMKERLMAAHFVEAKHVGTIESLADLAAEVGISRGDVVSALESNAYQQAVENDISDAKDMGITGVPFFVINQKYGISGAQDSMVLLDAFKQVAAESSEAS